MISAINLTGLTINGCTSGVSNANCKTQWGLRTLAYLCIPKDGTYYFRTSLKGPFIIPCQPDKITY